MTPEPQKTAIREEIDALVAVGDRLEIRDEETYEAAGRFLVECAVKLRKIGEVADHVLSKPITTSAPKAAIPARPEGVSFRKSWGFEIVGAELLPREYLTPDLVKIGGVVRAMGPEAEKGIPGIRVFEKTTTAVRTR